MLVETLTTSLKVAASIPVEVLDFIFQFTQSFQSLTEMSTRNLPGG
jgi:hypothetical protein